MPRIGVILIALLFFKTSLEAQNPGVVYLHDGRVFRGLIETENVASLIMRAGPDRRLRIPVKLIRRIERGMQPIDIPGKRPLNVTPGIPQRSSRPAGSAVKPTPGATTPITKQKPKPKPKPKAPVQRTALPVMTLRPVSAPTKVVPATTNAVVAPKPAEAKKTVKKPAAPKAATPKSKSATAAKTKTEKPKPAPKKKPATKPKQKQKPKAKGKWAHDLRLGLDMRYSIVDQQTAHVRLRSSYTRSKWRTLFDWSYAYGESEQRVTSDRMNGSVKTDVTFEPGWYLYGSGASGYDITRRIELRTEFGSGAGYHLLKGKRFLFDGSKLSMDIETGGEYQDKKSTTGISIQKYFWRLGNQLTWDPIDDLRFTEKLDFYPQIGELVSHRYRLEGNIAYKIIKNLSLNLTVLVEAEPESVLDFEPDDIQLRSSLGWKF